LREDYVYYQENQKRKIAIAGFFRPTYNSTTACIAILDGNSFEAGQTQEQVQRYRSFGSPVILVYRDDILQFWHFSNGQAVRKEQKKTNELDNFFGKYKDKFSPTSILRAKTRGRFDKKNLQLSFFDYGLMPIIEKQEGEYLSGLIERIINKLSNLANIDQKSDQGAKWLTQAAFWLVGAKILKDKGVPKFETLDITDIKLVSGMIGHHYGAKASLDISSKKKKDALEQAATEILEPVSSFAHLTIDSLAYVYENTLVTPATRKALGTHATPSWLVNYIVWGKLLDWIEKIPEKDRIILEPACGHAPFLTAGAKILSFFYKGTEKKRHEYLKSHLIGLEKDIFAEEIARLALTLTDIPNEDGWQIINSNIYDTDILQRTAEKATILLCNPPFENFLKEEKKKYKNLKTGNKAAEVLARTLPYMREGSVFGIILPQGFLHKKSLAELRKYILDNCELRTICNLPADNVFAKAGHPSTVLLGRKVKSNKKISYLRVHKSDLEIFKDSYQAKEEKTPKGDLYKARDHSFRVLEFKDIWEYCSSLRTLGDIADIGRGIEHKPGLDIDSRRCFSEKPGFQRGFYNYNGNPHINMPPDLVWLNTLPKYVQTYGSGASDKPKILVNRIRGGRSPWRLRAWLDVEGYPFGKAFISVVPKIDISLYVIWAFLNSPFVNVYLSDYCMDRDNIEGVIKKIPIPDVINTELYYLQNLVENYFALHPSQAEILQPEAAPKEAERRMLAIDAEVMRLYNLPPKLEKQLLDFFAGYKRKGVDFDFKRYYPEGFESWIPLHEYLSEEYQRSTPSFVKKWVEEVRSPELIKALEIAMEAFED